MTNKFFIPFLDVLFILLLGTMVLFTLTMMLINPVSKKADIDSKDYYMVVLEWNNESESDVDLWLNTPIGAIGYNNRQSAIAYLDRDDLGLKSDYLDVEGIKVRNKLNREVIFIKRHSPGFYVVNVHIYDKRPYKENIRVSFFKIKPTTILLHSELVRIDLKHKQEYTMFTFDIYENSTHIKFDNSEQIMFLPQSTSNGFFE